jgi:hypothetical protein
MQIESELLYFRKNSGLLAVILDVGLHTLANFLVPMKRMVKTCRNPQWKGYWVKTALCWKTLGATSFGTHPTR